MCAPKFSCVRSSHGLWAHAQSLKGTLVTVPLFKGFGAPDLIKSS